MCIYDFFDSCITVENTAQAVFAQGDHAELDGLLANDHSWRALVDQTCEWRH